MGLSCAVLGGMADVAKAIAGGEGACINFKLLEGFSAETSGGLLICLPRAEAEQFCKEIEVCVCVCVCVSVCVCVCVCVSVCGCV